jgi:hypothetical protein
MMAENSPSLAMNFNIPVKVTVLVQLLVCFGILASTVSITRSVVQSNVAKLNANLGHLHGPSGQVESDPPLAMNVTVISISTPTANDTGVSHSTSTAVNDTVVSNSTSTAVDDTGISHIEEFDYTKLHGYIVSNKERRYNSSKTVLDKLGLVSHHFVPLSYKSEAIRKGLEEFHVDNRKFLTDRYKKVFSNRMAFTDMFQQFVDDPLAAHASWRFFFEDDIALHPSLTKSLAQKVLARGLEVAAGDGILYLGICGPNRCERKKVDLTSHVEAMRCAGACTHAFGLTKWKTVELLAYMEKQKKSSNVNSTVLYFDQVMRTYGEQVQRIWVLGSNLMSPQVRNHFGLVYQDRTNYPSVINNQEPTQ